MLSESFESNIVGDHSSDLDPNLTPRQFLTIVALKVPNKVIDYCFIMPSNLSFFSSSFSVEITGITKKITFFADNLTESPEIGKTPSGASCRGATQSFVFSRLEPGEP